MMLNIHHHYEWDFILFYHNLHIYLFFFYETDRVKLAKANTLSDDRVTLVLMVAATVKAKFSKSEMCFMVMAHEDPPSKQWL